MPTTLELDPDIFRGAYDRPLNTSRVCTANSWAQKPIIRLAAFLVLPRSIGARGHRRRDGMAAGGTNHFKLTVALNPRTASLSPSIQDKNNTTREEHEVHPRRPLYPHPSSPLQNQNHSNDQTTRGKHTYDVSKSCDSSFKIDEDWPRLHTSVRLCCRLALLALVSRCFLLRITGQTQKNFRFDFPRLKLLRSVLCNTNTPRRPRQARKPGAAG